MKWDAISFDWNQVRGFLATVEEGSLSAAARALGQTQPTLGRQVAALERALGVVLFERVGRALVVTSAGTELLEHVRAMAEAAGRISLAASGQSDDVEGLVRITAADVYATYFLPQIVADLHAEAPLIEIEIISANDIRDLQHREADIAIRHVRPEQPELIAKLVYDAVAYFYASKGYLDRRGRPTRAEDLADHDFIAAGSAQLMVDYLGSIGIAVRPEQFKLNCADGIVMWQLARLGLGLCAMDERIARLSPEMEAVLPQATRVTFPVWLTTHRELHTSRRIRLVFDHLARGLEHQRIFPPNASI